MVIMCRIDWLWYGATFCIFSEMFPACRQAGQLPFWLKTASQLKCSHFVHSSWCLSKTIFLSIYTVWACFMCLDPIYTGKQVIFGPQTAQCTIDCSVVWVVGDVTAVASHLAKQQWPPTTWSKHTPFLVPFLIHCYPHRQQNGLKTLPDTIVSWFSFSASMIAVTFMLNATRFGLSVVLPVFLLAPAPAH